LYNGKTTRTNIRRTISKTTAKVWVMAWLLLKDENEANFQPQTAIRKTQQHFNLAKQNLKRC
jgi:hypothetical protein